MWRWNSNRPGRSRAGSSDSTKLVVPTTNTSSSLWKPSISVSSWLTIECSTPEPVYVPRAVANESSSSNTMMDGADWRAWWKTCRRFSSLSPTHFDFSSGPDTIVMAAPMAVAMALAKYVFPVPGGPQKIMPRGISSSSRATSSGSVARSRRASTSRISALSRCFTLA